MRVSDDLNQTSFLSKRSGYEGDSMASTAESNTTKYLTHVTNLSLIATSGDVLEFLGIMTDCYMDYNVEGISTRECFVYIPNKNLLAQAINKTGELLLGRPVKIEKSRVTVDSFLSSKNQTKVTRLAPFGILKKPADVELFARKTYKNISKVVVENSGRGQCLHKVAILTFNDHKDAALAMEENKTWLKNHSTPSVQCATQKSQINAYLSQHNKEMFWA